MIAPLPCNGREVDAHNVDGVVDENEYVDDDFVLGPELAGAVLRVLTVWLLLSHFLGLSLEALARGPHLLPSGSLGLEPSIRRYHLLDDNYHVVDDGRDDGNNRHGQEVKLAIELGVPGSCNSSEPEGLEYVDVAVVVVVQRDVVPAWTISAVSVS